jgi:RHS repeat-associated protein
VEIAGFVRDGWCACCCVCFNVDGNELTVGVDEVLMFGAGVLFDLFVEFADVGGSNGGVATGFGLGPSIPDKTRYLHYDNLGSIDTITNGQGNIVERMAYTSFGQRRQGDWRAIDPLLPIIPALTNRGFTGHEHIDEMGFIHMDGRVYDPSIGRFLSVVSVLMLMAMS